LKIHGRVFSEGADEKPAVAFMSSAGDDSEVDMAKRDNSMVGRSAKWIDDRAKRNAKDHWYNPPYTWIPFVRDAPGTEARDRYDRAYKYHSGKGKK
jgi:hypothetical protein